MTPPSEADRPPAAGPAPRSSCVWVAINRPDGPPHVTPVWFVSVDDALWFTTSAAAHKAELMLADGRVSLAFDASADGGGAVAEGRAEVLEVDARPDVIAAFAEKYHGWDAADPSQWGARILVRVGVDRWLLGP